MKQPQTSKSSSPVGRRIFSARLTMGLSQEKLGVMIGLEEGSAGTRISRYESGIHEPPVKTSMAIAKALCVPLAYLYCDNDVLATLIIKIVNLNSTEFNSLRKKLS